MQYYNNKGDEHILNHTVYVALVVGVDGTKDNLRIWIEENESPKFWLNILNNLKNRDVEGRYSVLMV